MRAAEELLRTAGRAAAAAVFQPGMETASNLVETIAVRYLDIMNDDPAAAHVLYAKVALDGAPAGQLERFCEAVLQAFRDAALIEVSCCAGPPLP